MRDERREVRALLANRREERARAERAKDEAVLARLRMGGPDASERAICREFRVSPKRVVRLRALVEAERRAPAG